MTRLRSFVFLMLWCLALSHGARAAGMSCGAARDLVVQALEGVSVTSSDDAVRDSNELLKRAASMCSSLGDAWYYRSLMEHRLGKEPLAHFALDRARLIGSEAMEDGLDPFHLAAPTGNPQPLSGGTRWALVIGIGKFKDGPLNTLRYADGDARLFASALTDPAVGGFAQDHVHVLLNDEATTRNIKASLNWIARQAQPQDLVVVYVATHGSPRDLDSVGGINYLITSDTEGGSSEDQDALFATALPMIDLVNTIATRIRATRTAIFLDACYTGGTRANGTIVHAQSPDEHTLAQFGQGAGRIVMSAARGDQESHESAHLQHGFFTSALVQTLRQQHGATPLTEVFQTVHRQVLSEVATELRAFHISQEPVLSRSSEQTDFAFRPAAAETEASLRR